MRSRTSRRPPFPGALSVVLAALLVLAGGMATTGRAVAAPARPSGYVPITATGTIVSVAGGFCLDARNASHADGTPVQLYACNGTAAQRWTLTEKHLSVSVLGSCLTPVGDSWVDGTKLELDRCDPRRSSQQWSYTSAPAQQLFNGLSGDCLDIPRGKPLARVQLQIYHCNWTDAQRWQVPGV